MVTDNARMTAMGIVRSIRLAHGELTREIIGSFFDVYNSLGPGFLESVYQHALSVALARRCIPCQREVPFPVFYEGIQVGDYRADLIVAGRIVVETKCADRIVSAHLAQTINYLKASNLTVGLILNFGPQANFRRVIL